MPSLLKRGRATASTTRLFYASDIHGSQPTYRKFLNAARFYDVDALVFGGDLMGKLLVPIVKDTGGSWRARLHGQNHHLTDAAELSHFLDTLQTLGFYWKEMDPEEYRRYEGDQQKIDALFDVLAKERLRDWVRLAEERLAGTRARVYLCGGNDDTEEVLTALGDAEDRVINAENRVVELDDQHTLATIGYSTPTPWETPREKTDDELSVIIKGVVEQVPDPELCVFNFHCPPLDSGLDTCLKLDASVWPPTPLLEHGQPIYYGGGSQAVTDALITFQPTVGLHGHIHESRGMAEFGRTPAFNPGSEYGEGVLRGVIVAIQGREVVGHQFTSG